MTMTNEEFAAYIGRFQRIYRERIPFWRVTEADIRSYLRCWRCAHSRWCPTIKTLICTHPLNRSDEVGAPPAPWVCNGCKRFERLTATHRNPW